MQPWRVLTGKLGGVCLSCVGLVLGDAFADKRARSSRWLQNDEGAMHTSMHCLLLSASHFQAFILFHSSRGLSLSALEPACRGSCLPNPTAGKLKCTTA